MDMMKIPVHVEVVVKETCSLQVSDISRTIKDMLGHSCPIFKNGSISLDNGSSISEYIESLRVCDLSHNTSVSFWQAELCLHIFKLYETEPEKDFLEGDEELAACEQWELPNRLLSGLWDSIISDEAIKYRLLGYCDTSMAFAEANINSNIISWNRMVLLHGPPGTGKTTLCKALAQKVYTRNMHFYETGVLLEINAHSLFSKWFSESGKLVMKLFDHVSEVAEDDRCFVAVLIDEVESMVAARSAAVSGNEPGDAVRVVNAVLTSLDSLRRKCNVLILCTSNLLPSIDQAFLDRVDLSVYMGPPPTLARYFILHSCLLELMNKGIIRPFMNLSTDMSELAAVPVSSSSVSVSIHEKEETSLSLEEQLLQVAHMAEGMSGRALRKLPIKSHAFFLQRPVVSAEEFILAMLATIKSSIATESEYEL